MVNRAAVPTPSTSPLPPMLPAISSRLNGGAPALEPPSLRAPSSPSNPILPPPRSLIAITSARIAADRGGIDADRKRRTLSHFTAPRVYPIIESTYALAARLPLHLRR